MNFKRGQIAIFLLAILVILIGGGTVAYLLIQRELVNIAAESPNTGLILVPTRGTQTYVDPNLPIRFDYPKNLSLSPCENSLCQEIPQLPFKLWPLTPAYFPSGSPEVDLSTHDLHCNSSDGVTKSCLFDHLQTFTSKNLAKGFIVYRKVTITNGIAQTYPDHAYVFLLQNQKYPAILLTVDLPSTTNLSALDKIAASFALLQK